MFSEEDVAREAVVVVEKLRTGLRWMPAESKQYILQGYFARQFSTYSLEFRTAFARAVIQRVNELMNFDGVDISLVMLLGAADLQGSPMDRIEATRK